MIKVTYFKEDNVVIDIPEYIAEGDALYRKIFRMLGAIDDVIRYPVGKVRIYFPDDSYVEYEDVS